MRQLIVTITSSILMMMGTAQAAERPRVGLVLGGGGAKAGTQLGVLRVMEENRVPVDFVVGTSMGSFVGALYAMGYPLDDIEAILLNTDWPTIFSDVPDRKLRPMRRKQDDYNYLVDYKLGVSPKGLHLPEGIMGTHRLRLLLRELSLHLAHVKDFDQFPIPYRAVSMDIADGSQVVVGKGELPDAVRSSMSLPGIFPPVLIDGKYLVDGGSVANLPIVAAKENGVEVIIAVDVGADFHTREELESFLTIMDQLTLFLTRGSTVRAQSLLGEKDILVRPDVTGLTTQSYDKIGDGFERGKTAANLNLEKFRKLSVSEEEYQRFRLKRERPNRTPPKITAIRVDSPKGLPPKAVDRVLRAKPGEPLNVEQMHEDIEKLYAFEAFKEVRYDFEGTPEESTMVVRPMEDPRLKNFFRPGFRFETDFSKDVAVGIAGSLYATRLNDLGAEWKAEGEVGTRLRFFTELLQPIDPSQKYFLAPSIGLERRTFKLATGSTIVAEDRVGSATFDLGLGRFLSNWGELRVAYQQELGDIDQNIGVSPVATDQFTIGKYYGRFLIDTLDNLDFPLRGFLGSLRWDQAFDSLGDSDFQKYAGRMVGFGTIGRNTFGLGLEGGGNIGGKLPTSELYSVGGLFRLSGFQRNSLSGQYFALTRVLFYHRIGAEKIPVANVPVYIGASFESGGTWLDPDDISLSSWLWAGSGFIGMDTILGPVIVAGGYGEDAGASVNLLIGQPF